ncbi:MAG TPA: DNA-binding protein [archaeon]|nr:DNA-binding protein [archaeon]
MNEEEIKKKMLQQRMAQMSSEQMQQAQQQQQMEDVLKTVMSQVLDREAKERLSNLKLVKPEIAMQLEMYLAQLFQSGQLRERITDEQLVIILKKITEKRETKIRRK